MNKPFEPSKKCPDISTCRATQLGAGSLVFCLSRNRVNCDYPLPFGVKYFCLHPQCMEIADRSARLPPGNPR